MTGNDPIFMMDRIPCDLLFGLKLGTNTLKLDVSFNLFDRRNAPLVGSEITCQLYPSEKNSLSSLSEFLTILHESSDSSHLSRILFEY